MSTTINRIFAQEDRRLRQFQRDISFFPEYKEAACLALDGNSLLRNSMSAAQSFTTLPAATNTFLHSSSALAGVLGVPIGLSGIYDSVSKGKAALDYSDTEGVAQNALWGTYNASFTGISGLMGAQGAMNLMGTAIPATFTPAIGGLGVVMSAALLAFSGFGIGVTTQFRNALKKAQQQGDAAIVKFLKEQVTMSSQEMKGKSEEEIAKALQKKWNAFERNVGVECANDVRKAMPGIDAAKELIVGVEKANFKQRVKYITLLVVGIISAAAFIAMFLTTGPLSSILFAVGAAIWLTVDSSPVHNFIGEKCWAWHSDKKIEEKAACPIPVKS